MKKHKALPSFIIIGFCLISSFFLASVTCRAASATITLGVDKDSVVLGDEIIVSINIKSEKVLGDFEAYFSYDPDVLEFKSGASFIAGGDGLLKLTHNTIFSEDKSRKYVMKFLAKEVGTSDINIKDRAVIYDYETGDEMSLSSTPISISVVAKDTASDNNNLKSLKINKGTLQPDFKQEITEYNVQVGSEVEQLIISAVAEEESSVITIDGNENFKEGSNTITITVKAESGATKEYKLYVNKEYKSSSEGDKTDSSSDFNKEESDSENKLTQINHILVTKDEDGTYIQNGFHYQFMDVEDESIIPKGYIKTSLVINDIRVTAFTPEDDLDNEFLLLYVKSENGNVDFYQYDRVENTIQRYTKTQKDTTNKKYVTTEASVQKDEYVKNLRTMGIIIGFLILISIILTIVSVQLYIKQKLK